MNQVVTLSFSRSINDKMPTPALDIPLHVKYIQNLDKVRRIAMEPDPCTV